MQVIMLALSDDHERGLAVFVEHSDDDDDDDDTTVKSQLIVERQLQTFTDRLSVPLASKHRRVKPKFHGSSFLLASS